jgi:hypothetical protein
MQRIEEIVERDGKSAKICERERKLLKQMSN